MTTATPLSPSPRGPGCPPAAALEALSAGEPASGAVLVHVEACPDCSAQLAALRREADAFLRARPPERFLRQLARREEAAARPRPWLRRLAPVLGLAVPLALAVVLAPGLLGREGGGVTSKGGGPGARGFSVAVARAAGGAPELLAPDAIVHPGDALRFAYESDEGGHLVVLELDGRGQAAVLQPFGAAGSAPLAAGQRDFLPGSAVLDDAPGPEVIVAVLSPRPLEAAPLLEALRAQAGRAEVALACEGCRVTTLRLRKVP